MSQKETKKKKSPEEKAVGEKKASSQKRNPDGTFAKGNDFAEKYDDSYADALIEFFSQPLTRTEYKRSYYQNGEVKEEYPVEITTDFPTMGMFARSIGVSVSALKLWAGITEGGRCRRRGDQSL